MKRVLIFGTSSGIGKACVEYFRNKNYHVDTVSRKDGATFVGQISNKEFRNTVIENCNHDLVINTIGILNKSNVEMAFINYAVAADLTIRLYDKLSAGSDIINISSISATNSMNYGMPNHRIIYSSSKKALSDVCVALTKTKRKDVRVVTLEPDVVMPTDLLDITKQSIPETRYTNFSYDSFAPIKPSYIPKVIDWIINQPRWINIGRMTIMNNCRTNYENTDIGK
jgi:NADP-dependent 3-hydroxy acid dehydrogenase YdfG